MNKTYEKLNNSKLLICIRSSLMMLIPVLLIGSLSLMLKSFPIEAYQDFISSFMNGFLEVFLTLIYNATFGILSVYVVVSVSICYAQHISGYSRQNPGSIIASLIAFFIISGTIGEGIISLDSLDIKGMFTALTTSLLSSFLFDLVSNSLKRRVQLFTEGNDEMFQNALVAFLPTLVVILVAALVNTIVLNVFDGKNIHQVFADVGEQLFSGVGRNLGGTILFVVCIQLLWFFGIHGNNVLEPVCQRLFTPALEENQHLIAQGMEATEIYSKTFLDTFVNMGGSGGMMCLMLAILIFSNRRSNRQLGVAATVPGLFNISELITFGLPIVFNPIFIIPYILVPIVLILINTVAMETGLVPLAVNNVEWTTPIFLSGYLATDSIAGSILQLVNLTVGVLIYAPFVKLFDKQLTASSSNKMNSLVEIIKKSEENREHIHILSLKDTNGMVARNLAEDLQIQVINKRPTMYYQPQYDNRGRCIGAEALLRWNHSLYGMVYPPLVIKIAEESDKLLALEKNVFLTIMESMPELIEVLGTDAKISVNVTGTTIQQAEFEEFLIKLDKDNPGCSKRIMIEITEQAALSIEQELIDRLTRLGKLGYSFAIDDFSMGSTSIKYLQTSIFSLVKLDGSMTKSIMENSRSVDIVASITKLSQDLGIDVLAEYVETEQQREMLEGVGCHMYQGYLYSPAVPIDKLK